MEREEKISLDRTPFVDLRPARFLFCSFWAPDSQLYTTSPPKRATRARTMRRVDVLMRFFRRAALSTETGEPRDPRISNPFRLSSAKMIANKLIASEFIKTKSAENSFCSHERAKSAFEFVYYIMRRLL